jgi:hypothetical protein
MVADAAQQPACTCRIDESDPVPSGGLRARRGKPALRLSAGRVPWATIEFAQGFEDGVDADGHLQAFRSA